MNVAPTKEEVAEFDRQRAEIYEEQETMSIDKLIKEGSEKLDGKLTEVMETHEELVTELEGEIETLETANEELKSHVESLTELLLDAKNELLDIEEKGLSI